MNRILQYLFTTSMMILFISCSTKTELTSEGIRSKFGTEYMYDWNIDSTYILAINKKGKISAAHLSPLEYFIYDVQNDSVIFKESVSGGNVKWVSPSLVQINIVPGNIIDDEEIGKLKYKFDVIKIKKITNGE